MLTAEQTKGKVMTVYGNDRDGSFNSQTYARLVRSGRKQDAASYIARFRPQKMEVVDVEEIPSTPEVSEPIVSEPLETEPDSIPDTASTEVVPEDKEELVNLLKKAGVKGNIKNWSITTLRNKVSALNLG